MRCLKCHHEGIPAGAELCPSCGVHLFSLMRDMLPAGTCLKQDSEGNATYEIEYPLGRGGFGVTYRAHHVHLDQQVAIKEYYPREQACRDSESGRLIVSSSQESLYQRGLVRFLREGRLLAKVSQSNGHVVRVQDFFQERETAYLVMELIEGQTLRQLLNRQPTKRFSEEQCFHVISALVDGLAGVHALGICHLDLKPDNVMVSHTRQIKLVDFGAAKQALSSKSTLAFTPGYAPLEMMAGEQIGIQTDIYELGVMLYEMLTGNLPKFQMMELVDQSWQPPGVDQPWRGLIRSAMRFRFEDRPGSVWEWWESRHQFETDPVMVSMVTQVPKAQEPAATTQILESQEPVVVRSTQPERTQRLPISIPHPKAKVIGWIALVTLLAGSGLLAVPALMQRIPQSEPNVDPTPRRPIPTATPEPAPTATPAPTPTPAPTLSPSPTPTPTATPTPEPSPSPTATPTPTPTPEPSPSPTATPTPTPTPVPTPTPTPVPTPPPPPPPTPVPTPPPPPPAPVSTPPPPTPVPTPPSPPPTPSTPIPRMTPLIDGIRPGSGNDCVRALTAIGVSEAAARRECGL